MNTDNLCQQCSAPLSPTDLQGLCPRCLLRAGIGSDESTVAMAGTRRLSATPAFPFEFGDYRVLRLLGRGGMGAVYEAERRDTGRRVALKVLGHAIYSEEMRRRFLREGRLAASVNHPNTVYIFGSEEIGGEPVIAMELIAGGTLRDSIRKGPLGVHDAVDATLQVIAGLEAAADAGVLHRDVKPENCFVAPDGTVKVGDFGLSVSTLARGDSQLTASGVMLGTPAYAPPEQLRGDELDVRADIYSVGATLHALLTGRAPFEGDNPVHVVAAVLDKPPKPLTGVPAQLAQIVARCLAKNRADRPADYATLRDALLPFSSHVATPAPLGLRTVGGIVDCFFATLASGITMMLTGLTAEDHFLAERTLAATMQFLGIVLAGVAYFAIPEWLWGASLGKMLCDLRVAPHGFGRVVSRALLVMLAIYFGTFIELGITTASEFRMMYYRDEWAFSHIAGPAFLFLLFVTMRRRNGHAALHDLLTGTRVIVRQKADARPRLEAPTPAAPTTESEERIGPFRVTGPLRDGWLAAYDDALRRHVWIRKYDAETPALPPARRDIARPGRLRWLAGARDAGGGWDAFEAPSGKPLAALTAQPWAAVRCWLLDLAEEIEAASDDGTLPAELGIANVWITSEGRAVILDEMAGEAPAVPTSGTPVPLFTQHFLSAVADTTLGSTLLPLHARDFLQKLRAAAFDRATFLIGNLRSLVVKPATFTSGRRLLSLVLVPAATLILGACIAGYMLMEVSREEARWAPYPELRKLPLALVYYRTMERGIENIPVEFTRYQQSQAGKYLAGKYGAFIAGPEIDQHPVTSQWPVVDREAAAEIVRAHSPVTPEELARAESAIRDSLDLHITNARMPALLIVPGLLAFVLAAMCAVQFIAILFFRTTPGQRLFGFAIVDKTSAPISRGRMLWRWMLCWIPMFKFAALVATTTLFAKPWSTDRIVILSALAGVWLLALIHSIARPARGALDEMAGTRLVPR